MKIIDTISHSMSRGFGKLVLYFNNVPQETGAILICMTLKWDQQLKLTFPLVKHEQTLINLII